jgi:hypothetical protein
MTTRMMITMKILLVICSNWIIFHELILVIQVWVKYWIMWSNNIDTFDQIKPVQFHQVSWKPSSRLPLHLHLPSLVVPHFLHGMMVLSDIKIVLIKFKMNVKTFKTPFISCMKMQQLIHWNAFIEMWSGGQGSLIATVSCTNCVILKWLKLCWEQAAVN